MRMRRLGIMLLWLGGCTWINQGDIEARRGEVDDDGDGYMASEDCDDNEPSISPGAEEIWYDGIDSDCLLDDDYDADKDGFIPSEYAGLPTKGVLTSGELTPGDCDDGNKAIHPNADDLWYDGIDSNCGGEDDYDADADGYVNDAYTGLSTTYVADSGALPGGDCADGDVEIYPGASDEAYDGVDSDCGGEDDYDADADGFVPDKYVGLTTQYASGTGGLPGGDCDDEDANTYGGANDPAYDGFDWDCAGNDDYDIDGDGYVPDGYAGLETIGVSGTGDLPEGDCDDSDPEVYPNQIEVLSDSRDIDCDQDGSVLGATSFTVSDIGDFTSWDNPFEPEFAENVLGVYLSLATYGVRQGSSSFYDSALAMSFDPTAPLDGITGSYVWFKHVVDPSSYDLTWGHDFVLTNEYLFGVTGLLFDSQRSFRLGGFDLLKGVNGLSGQVYSTGLTTSSFSDISMTIDEDGDMFAVGCDNDDGVLQYMHTSLASAAESDVDVTATLTGLPVLACEVAVTDSNTGLLYTSETDQLVVDSFDLDATSPVLTRVDTDTTYNPLTLSARNDEWLVIADPGAVYIVDPDGFTYAEAVGEGPQDAELSIAPDGALVISYIDQFGDAHVLYGNPETGMQTFDVEAGFAATEAAAWVESSNTYLMVAVVGPKDFAYGAAAL